MFNIITEINELKTLTKHISCKCGRKFNSNQWRNNYKCQCECKKHNIREKYFIWNPSTCSCENGKYLASIIDDLAIMCYEIIESYNEETKIVRTNFNEKNITYRTQNFYILQQL